MKKGFTLAEVLITLGIIGIVAALTMPSLVAEFQKQVLKTQFKKAYSVYSQNLLKTTMIDFDGNSGCYYGVGAVHSGCIDFYEKFAANMNVAKICRGNALLDGCIPVYEAYAAGVCGGGYTENYVNTYNTAYVMNDGTILMPWQGNQMALFLFDINGKKGPNKIGHDLFSIQMQRDTAGAVNFNQSLVTCLDDNTTTMQNALFKKISDIIN